MVNAHCQSTATAASPPSPALDPPPAKAEPLCGDKRVEPERPERNGRREPCDESPGGGLGCYLGAPSDLVHGSCEIDRASGLGNIGQEGWGYKQPGGEPIAEVLASPILGLALWSGVTLPDKQEVPKLVGDRKALLGAEGRRLFVAAH